MKKYWLYMIALPLLALLYGCGGAKDEYGEAEPESNFEVIELTDNTVEISTYYNKGGKEKVVIPEKIAGKTVESLGDALFYGDTTLEVVYIPNGVRRIGNDVFVDCENLKEVAGGKGVEYIGENCFEGVSVELSTTLSISDMHYIGDAYLLTKEKVVLNEVVEISEGAFAGITDMQEIVIDGGISTIPKDAFRFNTDLVKVRIKCDVSTIEASAFAYTTKLEDIYIPESVTYIADDAFMGCSDNLVFHVTKGSVAEQFAIKNNIKYK